MDVDIPLVENQVRELLQDQLLPGGVQDPLGMIHSETKPIHLGLMPSDPRCIRN